MNDELQLEAAEYVLGTLPADERARFAVRMQNDPELQEAVQKWQARLAPLDETAAAAEPRETVWRAIEQATFGAAAHEAAGTGNVVQLRRRLSAWRNATILAGALAAGLAAVVVMDRLAVEPAATGRYVAVVDTGGREPALIAEVDTKTGIIRVRSLTAEIPAGHSLELWHIPDGEKPRSLGVLQASSGGQTIRDAIAAGPVNGLIAVTVEPEGGSPSGDPTGPVVYSGKLVPVEE